MPRNAEDIPVRVRDTMARHAMAAPGERILAAVSGGADSMALLHVLRGLGHDVEVAHLDHGTRGGESARDADFVLREAERLGLACHVERQDIAAQRRPGKDSFETRAREVRYGFLERTAMARGCAAIATGHQADDQAETVLLRLIRGASPGGLGGIPPVRRAGEVRVIRPLLDCHHAELVAWLEARGVTWREDLSNEDPRYLRNRVRHELLPVLECLNPAVRQALIRLSETQRCEDGLLAQLAKEAEAQVRDGSRLCREAFRALPEALQRRVLLRYAHELGASPPHDLLVNAVRDVAGSGSGKICNLDQGIQVYLGHTWVEPMASTPPCSAIVPLAVPGTTVLPRHRFHARYLDKRPEDLAAFCNEGRQVFDGAKLDHAVIRTRRDGDRFRPLGLDGSKKLKDWFIDAGVPRPARDALPLLVRGNNVLWAPGGPPSADVAITEDTTVWLEITLNDAD